MSGRHRVVVVGGGFGGLQAALRLARLPVDLTLVDRRNFHLFQPLCYQVATGALSPAEISYPLRRMFRRRRHVRILLAEVADVDLEQRLVRLRAVAGDADPRPLGYDTLIVAAGARYNYFGNDAWQEVAANLKTLDGALALRRAILEAFEAAELEADPIRRAEWLTFVVVGAGPTGVEMAGQIAELSQRSLHRNFRTIDPTLARVVLVEAAEGILTSFGRRLSAITERDLRRLGIDVRVGTMVTGIDRYGVDLRTADGEDERIPTRTAVWAAGMAASPLGAMLAEASGAGLDRMGRVLVEPDCSLPGHPEVFVVGDLMALGDLPGMAEVAMQSGRHAASSIHRRALGDPAPRPFHYRDLGSLATISRFRAVAKFGPVRVGGFVGWVLWLVVHLTFLTGFKNRASALARWAISFLGRGRSERTITEQQVVARTRLEPPRGDTGG